MLKMNENLRWLAINAPDWDNNFDRIARGSVGVDWFSSESFPGRIGFSREELRVAKAELADERMDNIARNGNDGEHYYSDITAYDPPGPTSMPECTFTTPDEDEAWRESEKRINPVWQSPHDAGGVCITHGVRYAAHEQCPMCVLASETTKEKSKAFENPEVKAAYDKQYSQYFRDVSYLDHIDVYRVHELFNVIDHALCHASKKLLTAGMRTGNKSEEHDVREARDTLNRWLEMRGE